MSALRKATRQKAKIRLGLSAVSGGGKTYTALHIAYGLCGDWSKVAMIDTENGSGDLYSHLGEYNVLPLQAPYSPEKYIAAIDECEKAGMEVIIVDSITHEWDGKGGCLEIVDQITQASQSKNSYMAWGKVTPRHQAFIDKLLQSKCHIITTVRRKQDYEMTKDDRGKIKVEKAGLKEVTRDGWEYELTINLQLDTGHMAVASKDRTGLFMDKPEFIPSVETGKLIREWCESGKEPIPQTEPKPEVGPIRPAAAPPPTDQPADKSEPVPGAWLAKSEKWNTTADVIDSYNKSKETVDANPHIFEFVLRFAMTQAKSMSDVTNTYQAMKTKVDGSELYKAILSQKRDSFK